MAKRKSTNPKSGILIDLVLNGVSGRNVDFLRKHGRLFNCNGPPPSKYKMGDAGQCFSNSIMAAVRNDSLTYVEGYAMAVTDPASAHHAWVIDENGKVIEHTWKWLDGPKIYFGVPIQIKFILKMMGVHHPGEFRALLDYPKHESYLISDHSKKKKEWCGL